MLGDHVQDRGENQPIQNGQQRFAADLGIGNSQEAGRHLHGHGLHTLLGHTAADLHHAQRHDKGRQLAAGDQRAVDGADEAADQHRRQNANEIRGNAGNANGGQQPRRVAVDDDHQYRADGNHGGAYGQINATGDDDKGHAQRHDAHARVIAQDIDPVLAPALQPRAEAGVVEAQSDGLDDDHQHQYAAGGEHGVGFPDYGRSAG